METASIHRAQFISRAQTRASAAIYISQAEYDGLVKVARQYDCLRQNLLRGGVDDNTIAVLSHNESSLGTDQESTKSPNSSSILSPDQSRHELRNFDPSASSSECPEHVYDFRFSADFHRYGAIWDEVDPHAENASVSINLSNGGVPIAGSSFVTTVPSGPQLDRYATRTIQLLNLSDSVTHADITAAIRGGQLLDVFIRSRDRTANVSFVHGGDAKAFFARTRKDDLYIRNKRVDLRWNDRQFTIPTHVAHKLKGGASRNLVVRDCDLSHTEESIRDDLEHIHNLAIIHVNFAMGDCYIKTNSVHNAIFARTCMMSRLKYKHSRIEWDMDECAQPPAQVHGRKQSSAPAVKTPPSAIFNRFELLSFHNDIEKDFSDKEFDDDSNDTLH